MVLVRGNDTYSGLEIAPEQTWGTKALNGWERVAPLLEESLKVEMTPLPQPKHFGQGGQPVENYDIGRQLVRGSFTVYPSYNAKYFHFLLGQGNGGTEAVAASIAPNGVAVTGAATHMYLPVTYRSTTAGSVSGVGNGFTIRAWKAGTLGSTGAGNAAGYVDTFTGCVVSKITWNQPDEDRPTVTFEFTGYALATGMIGPSTGASITTSPATYAPERPNVVDSSVGWTNPNNALTDDGTFATTTATNQTMQFSSFPNFTTKLSPTAFVQGVSFRVDGKKTDSGGTSTLQFFCYISNDNGSTWTSANATGNLTASEASYTVEVPISALPVVPASQWMTQTKIWIKSTGTVVGTPTWHLEYVVVTLRTYDLVLRDPQSDSVTIGMRDYAALPTHGTLPGLVAIGQNTGSAHNFPAATNTRGFTFTIDPHLESPPPFLNAFDTVDKPSHVDLWECTGTIRSMLEQDYNAANRPHYMYANRQDGCVRFRYVSANTTISGSSPSCPYAMDLYFPTVVWTNVKDSFDDVLPSVEWNWATYNGPFGITLGETASGGVFRAQWLIQTFNASTSAIGYAIIESDEDGGDRYLIDDDPDLPIILEPDSLVVAPAGTGGSTGWTTPDNAWADGGGNATTVTLDAEVEYTTFDVSTIPAVAEITSITAILDAKYDDAAGSGVLEFGVKLSWDGGTSWTTEYRTSALTTTETEYWIGGTGNLFGRSWTRAELDDLYVSVTARGSAIIDDPEWRVDFVRVRIAYIGQIDIV